MMSMQPPVFRMNSAKKKFAENLTFSFTQRIFFPSRVGLGRFCRKVLANKGSVSYICPTNAGIAQLVERNLAKVDVAGSNPVSRSAPVTRGTGAFGNRTERLL